MDLPALSCQTIRRIDQIAINQYQMPGIVLMENAGREAARQIEQISPAGSIVILCGKGNNGGDGYVIARHLQLADRDVRIISTCPLSKLSGDASTNAVIAQFAEIPITVAEENNEADACLSSSGTIVDSLLGTGAKPPLRGVYRSLVSAANRADGTRIAIDIPSGLDGDTGDCSDPTFQADHTLTFVAPKIGFQNAEASELVGELHVIPIGVPLKLLREIDQR